MCNLTIYFLFFRTYPNFGEGKVKGIRQISPQYAPMSNRG